MNKFNEIKNRSQYDQQTDAWYRIRHQILTASNIASVLEANPYFTKTELLLEKCKPYNETVLDNNDASDWGIKYEGVAIQIYEELYEERINKVGLLIHREFPFIGASPDGLRESGKLLEIKNVWNRRITEDVPLYYWIQVQMQLEVCDTEECDLFQCKIVEYETEEEYNRDVNAIKRGRLAAGATNAAAYWKLEKFSKHTIHRDRKWFRESALPLLQSFYADLEYYRTNQRYKQLIKKRKRNDDNGVSRIKMDYTQQNWNKWVGAPEVRNYILNDPVLDWLNANEHQYKRDSANHMNDAMNTTETSFKKNIFKDLMDRFDTVWIGNYNEKFSLQKAKMTIDEMRKGTPIIINGILHNYTNETYAIPDLIVRCDYINRLTNDASSHDIKGKVDEYRIVQVRYSTIEANADSGSINTAGSVKIYKAEAACASQALNKIFGWNIDESFIIARKWKINKEKRNWMGYIGRFDLDEIADESAAAIEWMKQVKSGKVAQDRLNPNMCNSMDYPWHHAKKQIALERGEITLLWNCGVKQRQILNEHEIYHWRDVKPELIDFKGNRAEILREIIKINKSQNGVINDFKKISKKKNKDFGKVFYIDFETVNEMQYDNDSRIEGMIYMIGLGWIDDNNKWQFQTFMTDRLDYESEEKMIRDWFAKISELVHGSGFEKYTLMHWSNAEQTMLRKAMKRFNMQTPANMNWFDLLKYYKEECIAVKGAFHYGLKTIANACYTNGLIDVKWEDNDVDGTKAMIIAWKCHRNLNRGERMMSCPEMQEIIRYNEIDCKVLWKLHRLICN